MATRYRHERAGVPAVVGRCGPPQFCQPLRSLASGFRARGIVLDFAAQTCPKTCGAGNSAAVGWAGARGVDMWSFMGRLWSPGPAVGRRSRAHGATVGIDSRGLEPSIT